jgi:hypothetical protein
MILITKSKPYYETVQDPNLLELALEGSYGMASKSKRQHV